jgi:hypothetical protein
METASDRERWMKIATALASPTVKTQAAMWELERKQMLSVVARFWDVEAVNFRNFVSDAKNSESTGAIVLTSLEDMPEGFIGILLGVCCPELLDMESLIGATKLPDMFDMVITGKEKDALEADTSLIAAELPAAAMRLLQLARANLLLQFLQNVLLLYQQVDVAVPHVDLAAE